MPPRVDTLEVVELLVEALRHDDPDVVATAIRGLSSLRTDAGRDAVVRLRTDARPHVRSAVLDYIAESDGMRCVDLIVEALRDEDPIVRMAAVDALDDLDAVELRPAILRLKHDPDEHVRQAVAWFVESREEG